MHKQCQSCKVHLCGMMNYDFHRVQELWRFQYHRPNQKLNGRSERGATGGIMYLTVRPAVRLQPSCSTWHSTAAYLYLLATRHCAEDDCEVSVRASGAEGLVYTLTHTVLLRGNARGQPPRSVHASTHGSGSISPTMRGIPEYLGS